ncbi:MAG: treY [Gemmatimonadetes bacterium]|nr:treY [Gemmatimonadota bacterium]
MTLRATYRLQFHSQFTFAHAEALAPYFADLGISHIYSSPVLTARAGSTHGYDVVDHARINAELGGEPAFRALVAALRARGIGIILDIVPNHMAVGGADNPYWLDVLEKGSESVFSNMFDIDWDVEQPGSAANKVVVPLLGKSLAECISSGEIQLIRDARLGKLAFAYHDHRFPLRLDDYPSVMGGTETATEADLSRYSAPDALTELLRRQHFRLAFWRDAGNRINWRRFFDITSLAAVRVEDDAVFEQTHATIFRLFGEGLIDGVRVDHVDGLADPAAYCRRLRARLEALTPQRPETLPREPAIILVEKILAEGELLPSDWGVDGTTGYDFMNAVSAFQHDPAAESLFTRVWTTTSGRAADFEREEREARREMLGNAFANALRTTASAFGVLPGAVGIQGDALERAVALLIEHFRAYRTYALGDSAEPPPGPVFDAALRAACGAADTPDAPALNFVAAVMRGEQAGDARAASAARDAVRRFNQLAAPVAAKAVEDTAFYRYGRLLSRNDVGFSPARFALSVLEMHAHNANRSANFPSSLLATATHDHKRGEDGRARLAALSEVAAEWEQAQCEWFKLNAPLRPAAVAPGDEYQLYQTLVSAWPQDLSPTNAEHMGALVDRILAWREKSLREAKLQTSWANPDMAFEKAHAEFVRAILDSGHTFVDQLSRFVGWLAPAGALNSLTSCVLRCTSPGVPDLYQGTELWDPSLVDPDNRRPVDYARRIEMLQVETDSPPQLDDWRSGAMKLSVIRRLLALRARLPEVFASGEYRPIASNSTRGFAFARVCGRRMVLVAVARHSARDAIARGLPLPDSTLGADLRLDIPGAWRKQEWRNGLLPEVPVTPLSDSRLFDQLPAAVLFSE